MPRQRKQQIERALIALDIDDQRRFVRRPLGLRRLERKDFRAHAISAPARATSSSSSARACVAVERLRRLARGERGIRARKRRACEQRRICRDLGHLVELAVAMQDHVAAGGNARARALGDRSLQGIHRHVIAHQQTLKPYRAANHIGDDCRRCGRRLGAIQRAKHNMGGHRHRQVVKRPERREIGPFQLGSRRCPRPAAENACRRSPVRGREYASGSAAPRPPPARP